MEESARVKKGRKGRREAALDQKAATASRGGDGVYAKEIAIKSAGAEPLARREIRQLKSLLFRRPSEEGGLGIKRVVMVSRS